MKKILISMLAALQLGAWSGNVLMNGQLNAEQSNFPDHWAPVAKADAEYSYDRSGGPGGKPAVMLKGRGTLLVRQNQLVLVPGERYKLSGYFKTKDLKSPRAGVAVINSGWADELGIVGLPENSDWQYHEKTFDMIDSENGTYGVVIQIRTGSGELQAADLKLEPLTEAGRRGQDALLDRLGIKELIPLSVLRRIPENSQRLVFEWAGKPVLDLKDCECIFQVGDGAEIRAPFDGKRVTVELGPLKPGEYGLLTKMVEKGTGKTVYERSDRIGIVRHFEPGAQYRQLNNLVAELLDGPVAAGEKRTFINPRDGWVFIQAAGVEFQEQAVADEAFRFLKAGEYGISATVSGPVAVRAVPELVNYPPCFNSRVNINGNGLYDWAFMKRHVLQAVTTHNGGRLPGAALDESRQRGLHWVMNLSKGDMATLGERLANILKRPEYEGVALDEFLFGRWKELYEWGSILQGHRDTEKLIYTWIVGKPSLAGLDSRFISTSLNASRGYGKLWYEAYAHPQNSEEAAAAYLKGMLNDAVLKYDEFFPGALKGMGMIFGNFTQLPILALDYLPEVDYKYYLDMQLNVIANSPDFNGLQSTGFWGSYYADEEMYRWSFRLLRHYAVEGRREMLSSAYGFKYNPGLLLNGDFTEGLKHWTASGDVGTGFKKGYGELSQGRWMGGNDTFCTMTRGAGPNRLSQTAGGLVPGKWYTLNFAVADYNDVMKTAGEPRALPLAVELENATIDSGKSYVYIDDRPAVPNKSRARVNIHRIVFRADAETCRIEFHDREAKAGEKQALNYIALRPYFSE